MPFRLKWTAAILALLLLQQDGLAGVVITEAMGRNTQTLADQDGDFSDWFELLNDSLTPVDIGGWSVAMDGGKAWRFPSPTRLEPNGLLVVFASGKDRAVPGNELHTGFNIPASGGPLRLSDSTGAPVAALGLPEQLPDVAFGLAMETTKTELIGTNAPVLWTADPQPGLAGWAGVEIDDSAWLQGTNGLGFDQANGLAGDGLAARVIQAQGPLIYYRFDGAGTAVPNKGSLTGGDATLSASTLRGAQNLVGPGFPGFESTNTGVNFSLPAHGVKGPTGAANGLSRFSAGAWFKPGIQTQYPAGIFGQQGVFGVYLRDPATLVFSTEAGGGVEVPFTATAGVWRHLAVTADGEVVRLYLDGVLVETGGTPCETYGGSGSALQLGAGAIEAPSSPMVGGLDEFAFFPRTLSDDEVLAQFQSGKFAGTGYAGLIRTDAAAAVYGKTDSAFARIEFNVEDPGVFDGLLLQMAFDDAFEAYLNGQWVASANLSNDGTPLAARTGPAALRPVEFNISPFAGLLVPGRNVLAFRAVNFTADDPDFLLQAVLQGVRNNINAEAPRYLASATPGRINGSAANTLGPLIAGAAHTPHLPLDSDDLVVTARVSPILGPVAKVRLGYRVMQNAETLLEMRDDGQGGDAHPGDGIFSAVIPAAAASKNQMVRYYVMATDSLGRSTRWPPYTSKVNSPQYLGTVIDANSVTSNLPVLHWFAPSTAAASSITGGRCSLYYDGEFYDNIFANLHGQSSQGFPKPSFNMNFNTGAHFRYPGAQGGKRAAKFNLITTYADKTHMRNMLAYETFRDAGAPYHLVVPVRVQFNGAFYSDAHYVEDGDEDYLSRLGLDPRGALYKCYDSLDAASGSEKKSRRWEKNADLTAFIAGLKTSGAVRTAFLYDNVDIPEVVDFLAATILTGGVDCCFKNYYVYRDSEGTGEWSQLPWDQDLTYGHTWTAGANYFDDTVYFANSLYVGSENRLDAAIFADPKGKAAYLRRVRTLMDKLLQPPSTPAAELLYERKMDAYQDLIAPDAALDFKKWATWGVKQTLPQAVATLRTNYFPKRRNFLFVTSVTPKGELPTSQPADAVVKIQRVDYSPLSGNQREEFIEIKNTNGYAVDMSGWRIKGGVSHTFHPGTVLTAGSSLYVSPDVTAFRARATSPKGGQGLFVQGRYGGQLSARGETVSIVDDRDRKVDSFTFPGAPSAAQQFLRISEILFRPPRDKAGIFPDDDHEFVALQNTGAAPLDLSGVHFTNGIRFQFTSQAPALAPGATIYLARNPEAFKARYGNGFAVVGGYQGSLDDVMERLQMDDRVGEKILDFTYQHDWQPLADGAGHSLMVVDPLALEDRWGKKSQWKASQLPGGSPAEANWQKWRTEHFTPAQLADISISGLSADPDHDGQINYGEYLLGTQPDAPDAGLVIEPPSLQSGMLVLRVQSMPGRVYRLETRTPESGAWTGLDAKPGNGETLEFQTPASPETARFHRISISLW